MPFSSTDASRIKNDMGFTGYGFGRPNREKSVCCTGFERAAYSHCCPGKARTEPRAGASDPAYALTPCRSAYMCMGHEFNMIICDAGQR